MSRITSAGTAPRPSGTRQMMPGAKSATMNTAMTAKVSTSPTANMNCQRLPITSRLPFGIDSMM